MPFIVADVGGTTLRTGCWDGTLSGVRRVPVRGTGGTQSARVPEVQAAVLDQLTAELRRVLATPEGRAAGGVGIAFAGPVTSGGVVTAAPTVWGGGGPALDVQGLLRESLGLPVTVVNDTTAAAWRYVDADERPFCLFTVSSGISNKIFHGGSMLLSADGHGGELGHLPCDGSPDAPLCDCGERGHLGALASGRGMLAAARAACRRDPRSFAGSLLHRPCDGDPALLSNEDLVRAVHAGDPLAVQSVRAGLRHLARAVNAVFLATGIGRYVFVGGFALALGERFVDLLAAELDELGCFGLAGDGAARAMLRLGEPDDDHGLIGLGRLLHRTRSPRDRHHPHPHNGRRSNDRDDADADGRPVHQ